MFSWIISNTLEGKQIHYLGKNGKKETKGMKGKGIVFSSIVLILTCMMIGCGDSKLPVLTSVSPSEGFVIGGDKITLTGSGFLRKNENEKIVVKVGGQYATDINIMSDREMTAVTPAGPSGLTEVEINILKRDKKHPDNAQEFAYILSDPPPPPPPLKPEIIIEMIGEQKVDSGEEIVVSKPMPIRVKGSFKNFDGYYISLIQTGEGEISEYHVMPKPMIDSANKRFVGKVWFGEDDKDGPGKDFQLVAIATKEEIPRTGDDTVIKSLPTHFAESNTVAVRRNK